LHSIQFTRSKLQFRIQNAILRSEIALFSMKRGPSGYLLPISTLGETCRAFVPNSLPPDPPLVLDDRLQILAQTHAEAAK
jgi:hypothetical protein